MTVLHSFPFIMLDRYWLPVHICCLVKTLTPNVPNHADQSQWKRSLLVVSILILQRPKYANTLDSMEQ